MAPEIRILAESTSLYRAAAEEFARRAKQAVQAHGRFAVALSGGATPRGLYAHLASDQTLRREVPWEKVHFFWGDERHVPPDHADSNYRMAYETLLVKVPVPPAHIHRIPTEDPNVDPVARQYEKTLRAFFRLSAGQLPRFRSGVARPRCGWAHGIAVSRNARAARAAQTGRRQSGRQARRQSHHAYRARVQQRVLRDLPCQRWGQGAVLRAVVAGRRASDELPAALIRPTDGALVWLIDQAAGRFLNDVELRSEGADRDT